MKLSEYKFEMSPENMHWRALGNPHVSFAAFFLKKIEPTLDSPPP